MVKLIADADLGIRFRGGGVKWGDGDRIGGAVVQGGGEGAV